ncbi:MAG TPA: GntG family PLP-dependent aldolase [Mycobacteriales bacterium]|nr:GntG family PLP-dependent aldolase [Mycobacteriales bacterium]
MNLVDLRSDTVTRPTDAMRAAMVAADVGDDVYGEDPTVRRLEERVAGMFGHEAALFVPSGTMGNQLAIRLLVPPAEELLLDADAHIVSYEGGGAAQHGGIQTRTIVSARGLLEPSAVAEQVRPPGLGTVVTRAIAVEQTHNRGGGAVYPLSTLEALREVATANGAALHCDGARIWNAAVASGTAFETYGGLFDTLSVCFSKGLGAPVGSAVVGSAAVLAEGRAVRRRLGGGMRQAGILAAACLHALDHHVERLADDHARAQRIAAACADLAPDTVDPTLVETTIVSLDLTKHALDGAAFAARAREEGLLVSVVGARRVRMVLHLDADDAAVDAAIAALRRVL